MVVTEIFRSIQGEGTRAGLPCVFVRLTGCNLRCVWCDTAYAFHGGDKKTLEEVMDAVRALAASPAGNGDTPARVPARAIDLVEITGGEPLLQPEVVPLAAQLLAEGYTVMIETSGERFVGALPHEVIKIVDVKCPDSGEYGKFEKRNLDAVDSKDEIKFVIGTRQDYDWTKQTIAGHKLDTICPLLVSWVHPLLPEQQDKSLKKVPPGQTPISRRELAERIIADALPVRFQVQMHKVIWPPEQRGV